MSTEEEQKKIDMAEIDSPTLSLEIQPPIKTKTANKLNTAATFW